jgi:hypothetical protein
MSTATLDFDSGGGEEALHYRALHTGALIGLVLGVLSVFVVIAAASTLDGCLLVTPIPVLGMFMSLRALAKIRREPEAFTGRTIAWIGFALSFVFLTIGVGYGVYIYWNEVPDGYSRISFNTMKPDEIQERASILVPPEITALNGKKVFVKGYIRPSSISGTQGIDRFLLVRDNNQCCFGDLSKVKYYDQIDVKLLGSLQVEYKEGAIYRVAGILSIDPGNANPGAREAVFSLKADYAKH